MKFSEELIWVRGYSKLSVGHVGDPQTAEVFVSGRAEGEESHTETRKVQKLPFPKYELLPINSNTNSIKRLGKEIGTVSVMKQQQIQS